MLCNLKRIKYRPINSNIIAVTNILCFYKGGSQLKYTIR